MKLNICANCIYRQAVNKANALLKMKHGIVRLDNVWGVGGGLRPVKVLSKKVRNNKCHFV